MIGGKREKRGGGGGGGREETSNKVQAGISNECGSPELDCGRGTVMV